jgi:hypothetical protein
VGAAAKATGEAVGNAAKATGEALNTAAKATGEYLSPSKAAVVKAAEETLAALEKKWTELQAKAAPAIEETKASFRKARKQMPQNLAEAKARLVEAKDVSADVWQKTVNPALDTSLEKAKKLYEDTAAKLGVK